MLSIIILIFEILIFLIMDIVGVYARPTILIFLFIMLFSFGYMADVEKRFRNKPEKNAFILGYFFRVALLFFDLYGRNIYSLPGSGADSEWYYQMGVYLAELPSSPLKMGNFMALTAYFVRIFGDTRLYIQFVTMLFSVVTVHTADKIMVEMGLSGYSRRKAMLMLCLLPNFAILSSVYLRESTICMLITFGILFLVRWIVSGGQLKNILLSAVFIVASSYFHGGSIGILIGYVLLFFLYDAKKKAFRLSARNILLAALAFIVFGYLYTRYGEVLFAKVFGVDSIEDVAETVERGGSSYVRYVGNSNNILNMIIYTPIRIIMFLYSPFFFQIRGLSDIIALCFNSLFYLYVTFMLLTPLKRKNSPYRNALICLTIIAFATAFVFGWGVANTGTAIRHRDKLIVVWILMYALEKEMLQRKRYVSPPNSWSGTKSFT